MLKASFCPTARIIDIKVRVRFRKEFGGPSRKTHSPLNFWIRNRRLYLFAS